MTIPLILLGGSGSSGTTLVASVLDGLHDLRTGPETWLFHHRDLYTTDRFQRTFYQLLSRGAPEIAVVVDRLKVLLWPGGMFKNRDAYGLGSEDDELELVLKSTDLGALVDTIQRARHTAPLTWIDQTPKNAIAAREYLQSVPGARFVHVLRDGRDVVVSLRARWQREAPGHSDRTYLMGAAVNWSWDVHQARRARDLPGYLEVRYASFVRDPLGQTNRILAHLDRPPVDAETFATNRARRRSGAMRWGSKPSWGATPDQPITDRAVGRWRALLDAPVEAWLRSIRYTIAEEGRAYCFGDELQRAGFASQRAMAG